MLARHVRNKPFDIQLLVTSAADLEPAHLLAWSLYEHEKVEISKISVGRRTAPQSEDAAAMVTFVLSRPLEGVENGDEG
jgi:hypothetical protein